MGYLHYIYSIVQLNPVFVARMVQESGRAMDVDFGPSIKTKISEISNQVV